MRKILFKILPFFTLFLVWFVFAHPYFLNNKAPFPSTYQVNFFPPWSSYERFLGPVKNGAMPDVIDQIYPWRHFTIETWKKGQLPLWNPNSFSGNPHLANVQSAVFSPFNVLFFIMPFVDAWSILVLLQPLLSGVFMYLFLRQLKISEIGSLIGSVSFMFCGFMVVWMAYGTLSMCVVFLPVCLWAIEKNSQRVHIFYLMILTLGISSSFFSGHFQTSLYVFLLVCIYFAFRFITVKRNKNFLAVFLALVLGLGISLSQIIPSIQFYGLSVRSDIFIKEGGIPFYYLVNIFAPDFFGNPVTRNDWFGYYAEWASFIGIIPFTLSMFAFKKRNFFILFFFIFGSIVLLLSLQSPLQQILGNLKIPVLSTSNPSRIILLFSFSFAVLSAFGFDRMMEFIKEKTYKPLFFRVVPILIILLVIGAELFIFHGLSGDKLTIAKRNVIIPTGLFGIFLLLVIGSIRIQQKRAQNFMLIAIFFLVCFDSLRFAQKWMPFDPKDLVFQDLPVIQAMQKNIGFGRVFGNLGAHVDTYYNLPSIEGYDPLYIKRYGEFVRSAETGRLKQAERSVVKVDRNAKYIDRLLDFLGVNIIFHPVADTYQEWAYHVWDKPQKFSEIFKDDKFQVFKNKTALERARLFYDYEIIKKDDEIISRFYDNTFSYNDVLILEDDPSLERIKNIGVERGDVSIISYDPDKIVINIKTQKRALLFLSDNYYPGWRAYVNNKEEKIYRADYTFRAVIVPIGESRVEFVYNSFL